MIHKLARGVRPARSFAQFFAGVSALIALGEPIPAYADAASPASAAFFPPVTSYGTGGSSAESVAVADVDGDGEADLIVANCASTSSGCWLATENGSVGVSLGNADGTFRAATTYGSGGIGAHAVAVADVNRDGSADLLAVNFFSGTVGVLLGNGDGSFRPVVPYGSGGVNPQSISIADLNGDHQPDVVIANVCNADPCSGGAVAVLLGKGDGTFQAPTQYVGFNAQAVTIADVNHDHRADLVVASGVFTVGVLLGRGDGTFSSAASYGSGGFGSRAVAVADVNEDGQPDIVVSNCSADASRGCGGTSSDGVVGVLLGNGTGTFQAVRTFTSGGKDDTSLAVADMNGDAKLDLLVAHGCDASGNCGAATVSVLKGRGDGSFEAPETQSAGPSGASATSLAVADVNGDDEPDLLVAAGDTVGVLLHPDSPSRACHHFTPHRAHHPGRSPAPGR